MPSLMQNICAVLITKHHSLKRVSAFSFISIGYSFIDLSSFTIKKLRFCSLSFSECSGQISRKTVDSTYPINSFQDAGFSGKTSFRLLGPQQTRTHCRRHIFSDTNVSPFAHARNICCDTNFVSGTKKIFLTLFRNILCLQQMFPSLRSPRNIMGNNVSAAMCPRLPGP